MKTQLFHTLDNENACVLEPLEPLEPLELLEPFLILYHSCFL